MIKDDGQMTEEAVPQAFREHCCGWEQPPGCELRTKTIKLSDQSLEGRFDEAPGTRELSTGVSVTHCF